MPRRTSRGDERGWGAVPAPGHLVAGTGSDKVRSDRKRFNGRLAGSSQSHAPDQRARAGPAEDRLAAEVEVVVAVAVAAAATAGRYTGPRQLGGGSV